MSYKYQKGNSDQNHIPIRNHLKAHGVEVEDILKPLDLLCELHGYVSFIEVKRDDDRRHYTRKQLEFIANTRFNVAFARTGDEALYAMKTRTSLTQTQKDGIAGLLLRNAKTDFKVSDLREILTLP